VNGRDRLFQRLDALQVRVDEVGAWRDRRRATLPGLGISVGGEARTVAVGDRWPFEAVPTVFEARVAAPDPWRGAPVDLIADVGGEALLRVDGVARGGLNPFHDRVRLRGAGGPGDAWHVRIEAVPYGLFGRRHGRPHVERFELAWPDDEVRALHEDLTAALDGARVLAQRGERGLADRIVTLLRSVLSDLPVPRAPTEAYLARVAPSFRTDATGSQGSLANVWEAWRFDAQPLELDPSDRAAWTRARETLADGLDDLRRDAPGEGTLIATGHAHLDLAWLWPVAETRRKAVRTFATVLELMERHPDFVFGQSMAQLYAWLEQDEPALFERVRARVGEGRWELAGGMWVEPDGNLPSGEAWVRQLLHGQRWFASRFGSMPSVGWLPDTFGYAGNLPQLLRQAGLRGFFTTKLEWNDTNRFPYDLYRWEGIDGTRVLAHQITNPSGGYNGLVDAAGPAATWDGFRGKAHHDASLYVFGHGDGGGGPSEAMLERLPRLEAFPGLPSLRPGRIDAYFERADVDGLPVWRGEQYLELHRGTYTTQARIKRLNRRLEHVLVEAEAAATLAGARADDRRGRALHDAWTVLLRNQFHDVLPGSSVRTVNVEAERELAEALVRAETLRYEALLDLSRAGAGRDPGPDEEGTERRMVVWNLSLDARSLRAELPPPADGGFALVAPDGRVVAWRPSAEGILVDDADVVVPAMGWVALRVVPGESADDRPVHGSLDVAHDRLANERLEVRIAEDGTLASLVDRTTGRELLAGPGDRLVAHADLPRFFEAWELDPDDADGAVDLRLEAPPEVVESGPVRAAVRLRRGVDGVRVVQDLRLWRHGDRLEIATRIEVGGRRILLRSLTETALQTDAASFETAFGAVDRPTHRNTSWDEARFEVPAHRWALLDDGRAGLGLLNDGRYGHAVRGGTLGLTLIRAPVFPDPYADEGVHEVTYALRPERGGDRAGVIASAHDLNAPLQGVVVAAADGPPPASRSLLAVEGEGVRLAALKPAAEGSDAVLRLYQATGHPTRATVTGLPAGWTIGPAVDLLERPVRDAGPEAGIELRGYEVVSVRLARPEPT
jgi:alpha-mannosidase